MTDSVDYKSAQAELETLRDVSGTLTGALVADAAEKMAWGGELWQMFNCQEVEALANVFRRFGLDDDAATIIEAHSAGDGPGDLHCNYPW